MNRIDELFQRRDRNVLSVYFTAGYPELNDTNLIINGLEEAGADLIEIGFPFSDPVADGPVIQASSHQALENGMNLDILFDQLAAIRESSSIPKILMGYFNTVYQYGVEKFIVECGNSGVSGVIIPDLPPEVYLDEYKELFEKHDLHFICLVSPQTTPERVEFLASISRGFLYILSMSGITGGKRAITGKWATTGRPYDVPTLIGFGIHDHQSFTTACNAGSGAIIGSEFIRRLGKEEENGRRGEQETGDGGRESGNGRREVFKELCGRFVNEIRGNT